MPKSPVAATVTVTSSGAAGAGSAVSVKLALPPSVTEAASAVIVTSGVGGPSLSTIVISMT